MKRFKRLAPLLVSVGLVLGIGAFGIMASAGANQKAQSIHRQDRLTLQYTLAGLANQYMRFALKDALDFASSQPWSLRPGDPGDLARLKAYVTRSALFDHGAVLVDLTQKPLSIYAKPPGLPPATDRGFRPLIAGLLAKEPGLSSVMNVGGVPVVALGVPVLAGDTPRAVFLVFFRADRSPLQTYSERLRYGKTGFGYVVDSRGGIISATNLRQVGQRLPANPALAALAAGRRGFAEFDREGTPMVASYSPIDLGGWAVLTEQTQGEFFGPIRSRGLRVNIALVAVLIAAATGLAVLNHKRQTALRRAYEYKGELLANTTHELKTPLTAIRGAALTLGMRWRDMSPDHVEEFLGMIHKRCDALWKLVERILMGARLEAGRELPVQPAPVDVAGALRRIGSEFEEASPRHSIEVSVPPGTWVSADEQALDQILGLLTENAIKYSPDGGEVRLEAETRDGDVLIRVADPGIGMSAEEQEHIFEPYFKAQRRNSQGFGGVGLGLSIARHLVRRHGGEIWVTSKPKVGSVFSFTLPRIDPPEHAAAPEPLAEVGR